MSAPCDVDAAHHDAGQVGPDEPGATQVRVDELRSLQVVGPGEGCHGFSLSGAFACDGHRRPLRTPMVQRVIATTDISQKHVIGVGRRTSTNSHQLPLPVRHQHQN